MFDVPFTQLLSVLRIRTKFVLSMLHPSFGDDVPGRKLACNLLWPMWFFLPKPCASTLIHIQQASIMLIYFLLIFVLYLLWSQNYVFKFYLIFGNKSM